MLPLPLPLQPTATERQHQDCDDHKRCGGNPAGRQSKTSAERGEEGESRWEIKTVVDLM